MNRIDLIRTPEVAADLLAPLAAGIERILPVPCRVRPSTLPLPVAPDPVRAQVYSTAVLQSLQLVEGVPGRLLAVTEADLFVPILTFVFGEAQLPGRYAVVSTHRLREEFYGLPAQPRLLSERLLKTALHELGHTFGLVHCDHWECAMSSSHDVGRLDVRSANFCAACSRFVGRPSSISRLWQRPIGTRI